MVSRVLQHVYNSRGFPTTNTHTVAKDNMYSVRRSPSHRESRVEGVNGKTNENEKLSKRAIKRKNNDHLSTIVVCFVSPIGFSIAITEEQLGITLRYSRFRDRCTLGKPAALIIARMYMLQQTYQSIKINTLQSLESSYVFTWYICIRTQTYIIYYLIQDK